nr:MAG TPA: hypothetical protein [Bacteriophage sp.]
MDFFIGNSHRTKYPIIKLLFLFLPQHTKKQEKRK